MKEIEILVSVFDEKEQVKKTLSGFEYKGDKKVVDIYYFDPKRSQLQPDETLRLTECLRLRTKDDSSFITYKNDKFDNNGKWLYSEEVETKVEDVNKMKSIFSSIGLEELIVIDNTKSTYIKDNYEIVLEDVSNLGLFLEVEVMLDNDDVNVNIEKQKIQNFIDELGINVSEELNMGKPEMMLRKKA